MEISRHGDSNIDPVSKKLDVHGAEFLLARDKFLKGLKRLEDIDEVQFLLNEVVQKPLDPVMREQLYEAFEERLVEMFSAYARRMPQMATVLAFLDKFEKFQYATGDMKTRVMEKLYTYIRGKFTI